MKRNASIFMAAFYLLLATGMYVCFVSCGTYHLIEFIASDNPSKKHNDEKNAKHCKGEEDCSCCNRHGNYSVKEIIKPAGDFQFFEIPLVAENIVHSAFYTNYTFEVNTQPRPNSKAPPPGISVPIFIKIRSLLI